MRAVTKNCEFSLPRLIVHTRDKSCCVQVSVLLAQARPHDDNHHTSIWLTTLVFMDAFLDASKAFDRVDHSLLFEKLLNRDLPPVIARLLLSWYSSQQLKVRWAKTFSNCFHTTNGVRQGGVLSPILFTVYIDDLLIALEDCGIGCFWKHH